MSDAREIIAQYLCDGRHGWSGASTFERAAYRTAAHGMIAILAAAGFRILGPNEFDAVTLEAAAKVVETTWLTLAIADTVSAREQIKMSREETAAAIRALKEQEQGR